MVDFLKKIWEAIKKFFSGLGLKEYLCIGVGVAMIALCATVNIQSHKINRYKDEISELQNSISAYANENSALKTSNREFEFTVEQLNYLNDSLVEKMNDARKKLKIKDKEIERLGYIASTAHKKDTLVLRDTIFRDPTIKIDTTITDKDGWYRCDVGLYYPNIVKVEPTFKSEKYVITSKKRETVDPPKKCWIGRVFQRKHDVVIVDVVENNPFITNDKERFITIID